MKKDLLNLLIGIIAGLAIFIIELNVPFGIGVLILYIIPVIILSQYFQNYKKVYYLVTFYTFLLLLKLFILYPDIPQFAYFNRAVFIVLLFFFVFAQSSKNKTKFKLKESEERYKRTLDNMLEGCAILDFDWNYIYVNDENAKQARYTKEEMIGRNMFDLIPGVQESELFKVYDRCMKERTPLQIESSFTYEDDTTVWFDAKVRPVPEGIFILANDITERKKAEKLLRRSEENFRTLADNISQFAWMTDESGYIFWYNKRWYDYTGTTLEEMKGWGWTKVHHPDHVERVVEKFQKCIEAGIAWEDTFPIKGKDGSYRWFLSRALPIKDENGNIKIWFGTNTDITEQINIEEELRKSNETLEAFFANTPGILNLLDDELRYLKSDTTTPKYFDLDEKQILGKKLSELSPEFFDSYEKMLKNIVKTGQPLTNVEVQSPVSGRKGEITYWRASYFSVPLKDNKKGLGVIGVEITDIKKTQNELSLSQKQFMKERELLQIIIDTVPAMISIFDPEIHTVVLNKAFEEITGWKKEDYQNTNIMELVYPDPGYRKMVADYMQSLTPGFKDLTMVTKDGRNIETSWANVKIPDGRKVGIGIDITERKNIEQKLLATMKELERSNKELEQFAYVASHDLQSPLRQISGFIQLLERRYKGKLDENADQYLEYINSAAIRMSKLIQGLLELSKLTSNAQPFAETDINFVVNSAIKNIEQLIKEKNAKIIIHKLPKINGDQVLLIQLFQNLIQNGIKFHGKNSPVIKISSEIYNNEIIFSVEDNGIGIEKEHFDQVYTIFHRIHNDDQYSGYGIGLPVCKRIVEHHGGKIWLESEVGAGSKFYFSFPVN